MQENGLVFLWCAPLGCKPPVGTHSTGRTFVWKNGLPVMILKATTAGCGLDCVAQLSIYDLTRIIFFFYRVWNTWNGRDDGGCDCANHIESKPDLCQIVVKLQSNHFIPKKSELNSIMLENNIYTYKLTQVWIRLKWLFLLELSLKENDLVDWKLTSEIRPDIFLGVSYNIKKEIYIF